MKRNLAMIPLVTLALLQGCVVAPYGYPAQSAAVVDDYPVYIDGAPVQFVAGVPYPIIFNASFGWGYWDHDRRWVRVPPRWHNDLEGRYPRGRGAPLFQPNPQQDYRRYDPRFRGQPPR